MTAEGWASLLWQLRLYRRSCERCCDKLLLRTKWELWKWWKITASGKGAPVCAAHQNSCYDNSNNNLLCRAFQGTQGCRTWQKLHSSPGVSNWVSQTCGSNLFWVIRLSLIMSFLFLFWSTAGIWIWIFRVLHRQLSTLVWSPFIWNPTEPLRSRGSPLPNKCHQLTSKSLSLYRRLIAHFAPLPPYLALNHRSCCCSS